jgi:hypothetical protein
MKAYFVFLFGILTLTCLSQGVTTSIGLNKKEQVVFNKDTFNLYFHSSENSISLRILQSNSIIFSRIITKDSLLTDVLWKDDAYITSINFTAFDDRHKEFIFTTHLKRKKKKDFDLEMTFTVDLHGKLEIYSD